MGTIACMVSDGSDFCVLTNTHLAGEVGRPVRALLRGVPVEPMARRLLAAPRVSSSIRAGLLSRSCRGPRRGNVLHPWQIRAELVAPERAEADELALAELHLAAES
jgi:hypothetical protein